MMLICCLFNFALLYCVVMCGESRCFVCVARGLSARARLHFPDEDASETCVCVCVFVSE